MSLTWDPAHKGASCTLSGGNLQSDCLGGSGVRGTIAHDAADPNGVYFEMTGVSSSDGFSSNFIGLCNASWDYSDQGSPLHTLGYDANGWAITTNRNSYPTQPFNSGTLNGVDIHALPLNNFGADFIHPNTIGFLLKAGTLTLYGTGAYAGIVIAAFTGLTGMFYPATSAYPGATRDVVIAINGGSSAFAGTLPTGAVAWGTLAPVAAVSGTPVAGTVPLVVPLTDASTNTPTSWLWDFGDGTTSTAQNPTHTYTVPGIYDITLTATNAAGSSTVIKRAAVSATAVPLPPVVTVNPTPVGTALIAASADLEGSWITSSGSVVIVAGRQGGLVSLNSSGTVLHRLDGVLSQVAFAIADSGYVYCFDGRGGGAVVAVDGTTGVFTPYATFAATNCQGVLDGFVRGTDLVLAVVERASVVTFPIATPGSPGVPTRTAYAGVTLNNVLNDAGSTPLTDQVQAALGLPVWFPATAGASLTGPVTVVTSGPDARAQVE